MVTLLVGHVALECKIEREMGVSQRRRIKWVRLDYGLRCEVGNVLAGLILCIFVDAKLSLPHLARLNFGKGNLEQLRYHVRRVNIAHILAANKFGIDSRSSFFARFCESTWCSCIINIL